ncbi:MAG: 30S ribosome-binding factor RbfA [Anaerolineae bacterium]
MPTRRQRRVNELLLEELSLLVPDRLDDPRLAPVRVTRVETTQDMANAKVYVVTVSEDDNIEDALTALRQAEGLLRSEIAGSGLRRLPRLVFAEDKAYESGERVLAILAELESAERAAADDPAATDDAADPTDASTTPDAS